MLGHIQYLYIVLDNKQKVVPGFYHLCFSRNHAYKSAQGDSLQLSENSRGILCNLRFRPNLQPIQL